jgi:hypothetical protein
VPPAAYVLDGLVADDDVPSPNVHARLWMVPSPSVLVSVKLQLKPVHENVKAAFGGLLPPVGQRSKASVLSPLELVDPCVAEKPRPRRANAA